MVTSQGFIYRLKSLNYTSYSHIVTYSGAVYKPDAGNPVTTVTYSGAVYKHGAGNPVTTVTYSGAVYKPGAGSSVANE